MEGYVPAAAKPARANRARRIAIAVFVALFSVSVAVPLVSSTTARPWAQAAAAPAHWDAQIAPIAAEVATLRGLDFVHPVPVHYLDNADFDQKVLATGSESEQALRDQVTVEEQVFRALGFIGGRDDLLKDLDTSATASVLAFYDPDVQQIFVRGTTLDVEHRVTIAHELTHVLQDQHFDLRKLQARAATAHEEDALRGLVEGDAVRIQDDYLNQLSNADQKEYQREYAAEGKRITKATNLVPEVVGLEQIAPYEFAPSTIRVLLESGGNDAVNAALTGTAPSSAVFTDPGDVSPPVPVDEPLPPDGATRIGGTDGFGAFELFLTLATRLNAVYALDVSDFVAGGEAITFRSSGVTCYRVVVSADTDDHRALIQHAVEAWADGRDRTSIDDAGDNVGFTVCDPGTSAPEPDSGPIEAGIELLAVRNVIVVDASRGRTPGDEARCVGRVFLSAPGVAQVILGAGEQGPTAADRAKIDPIAQSARRECHDDPDSGLPDSPVG